MTPWILLVWAGALVLVCYWIYKATRKGSDVDEEQLARRSHDAA